MKCVFVCFVEHHEKENGGDMTCFAMANGEAAESREAFISLYGVGIPVTIINWFEVPEDWKNVVSSYGSMNDTFGALLGLDMLSDTPLVSDLLTTIFAEGFRSGLEHAKSVMMRFGDYNPRVLTELVKLRTADKK